jgi:hypothetical protein
MYGSLIPRDSPHRYPSHLNDLSNPPPQKNEMVVCATPAYNNKNSLRLVEYVEFWKLLGATKFYFYNKTIGRSVDRVIRYYQDRGEMKVINWTIEGLFQNPVFCLKIKVFPFGIQYFDAKSNNFHSEFNILMQNPINSIQNPIF